MKILKLIVIFVIIISSSNCNRSKSQFNIEDLEYNRVMQSANKYLNEDPVTISQFVCERSLGGKNDFYSEGDYWWPNPEDPDGPYIRKDGHSNPNNFLAHRQAMRNMSITVPTLVAAYKLTGEAKYANKALIHLKAWFVNQETKMNPNLLFGQAIMGKVSGRGIGIIDTIHLIEVAKAIEQLNSLGYLLDSDFNLLTSWFSKYTIWLTTHQYGIDERDHGNNHSAWWVAQVAAFSKLIGNNDNLVFCRKHFKEVVLPNQMDVEGKFTDELTRTKPYSYSLFNLEAFVLISEILSTKEDNLWEYTAASGQSTKLALDFMFPYIKDKSLWPYPPDIAHFDDLPVRGSALFFASLFYNSTEYFNLWTTLESDPSDQELIRTFVIRQPVLWID